MRRSCGLSFLTQSRLFSQVRSAVASNCTTVYTETEICQRVVIVSIISDRLKVRGIIMLFTLIPAIIGYAVIANIGIPYPRVKYGMTFLMATGLYSGVPCVLVWNSNNSAGHYKRATTSALQLMIANSGGFVAGKCTYPRSN